MNKVILICFALLAALYCSGQQAITKRFIKIGAGTTVPLKLIDCYDIYGIGTFDVDKEGYVFILDYLSADTSKLYKFGNSGELLSAERVHCGSLGYFRTSGEPVFMTQKIINSRWGKYTLVKGNKIITTPYSSGVELDYLADTEMLFISKVAPDKKQDQAPFMVYDLKNFVQLQSDTAMGITSAIYRNFSHTKDDYEYKGRLGDENVHVQVDINAKNEYGYNIFLVNGDGRVKRSYWIKAKSLFPDNVYSYFSGADSREMRVLRNGKLYFLGADNERSSLVVAEVDLRQLPEKDSLDK